MTDSATWHIHGIFFRGYKTPTGGIAEGLLLGECLERASGDQAHCLTQQNIPWVPITQVDLCDPVKQRGKASPLSVHFHILLSFCKDKSSLHLHESKSCLIFDGHIHSLHQGRKWSQGCCCRGHVLTIPSGIWSQSTCCPWLSDFQLTLVFWQGFLSFTEVWQSVRLSSCNRQCAEVIVFPKCHPDWLYCKHRFILDISQLHAGHDVLFCTFCSTAAHWSHNRPQMTVMQQQ